MNERIRIEDSIKDTIIKMSEGNPGAITVLVKLIQSNHSIDPNSAFGGMSAVLHLDNLNIYGSRIWMLYKDVCGENIAKMIAILRANQLGFLSWASLDHAIDNRGEIDLDSLGQ